MRLICVPKTHVKKGITTEDVIEITHLSPKRIAQLKAELKHKTGSSD
ncbi:MAG: hypothetical protein AAF310_01915 [Myxococcota bacterium]